MRKLEVTGERVLPNIPGVFIEAVEYEPQKRLIKYQRRNYYLSFPFVQFYLIDYSGNGRMLWTTASEQPARLDNIKLLPLPHMENTGRLCMHGIYGNDLNYAITLFWNTGFSYFLHPPYNYYFQNWLVEDNVELQPICPLYLSLKESFNPFRTVVYV